MPKAKELPPVELLRELFDYNPETGEVRWKVDRTTKTKAGDLVGHYNSKGHLMVGVNYTKFLVHRIIYSLYYGEVLLPCDEVDHINRIRDDNRIINLRKVDRSGNMFNTRVRADNTTGHKGVSYDKERQRWAVKLRNKFIGRYSTLEEAVAARKQAETDNDIIC